MRVCVCATLRHRSWHGLLQLFFYVLAFAQLLADFASCFALGSLLQQRGGGFAGDPHRSSPPALIIGYAVTAAGFVLFFGPAAVAAYAKKFLGVRRGEFTLRTGLSAVSGALLFLGLLYVVVGGGLLIGGMDVYCSDYFFSRVDCGDHGHCQGGGCVCEGGYVGEHCGHAMGCDSNPCMHSGTCTAMGGEHSCHSCAWGWRGEQDCGAGTGCDSNPCLNGGTCTATGGTHTCTCASGYSGHDCAHAKGCDGQPCLHGGTCIAMGGAHSCHCARGWNGTACGVGHCPLGAALAVAGGRYCGSMEGACFGPGGSSQDVNRKIRDHVISRQQCEEYCDAEAACVGYAYWARSPRLDGEQCALYGPGMAQGAESPWSGEPHNTTTIGGAGGLYWVCVAVAGRN